MAKKAAALRKSKQNNETQRPIGSQRFNPGRTTQDSRYLVRIKRAVAAISDHPLHHGVAMHAHHVISATGMHKSGLAEKIRKFGYDINLLPNLVFLPSTLQGACHLGVQPHRGNHTAAVAPDSYPNDAQPMSYHEMVAKRILRLKLGLTKSCPGYLGGAQEAAARHRVQTELNELSAQVLRLIQYSPKQAPLTKISAHFQPGDVVGCAGTDSTTNHLAEHRCAVGRNHLKRQGPGQKSENITFAAAGKYQLKLGR